MLLYSKIGVNQCNFMVVDMTVLCNCNYCAVGHRSMYVVMLIVKFCVTPNSGYVDLVLVSDLQSIDSGINL